MTESIAKGKVDIYTHTHTRTHRQIHFRVSKARYRKAIPDTARLYQIPQGYTRYRKAIPDTARQDYTRLDKTLI